MSVKDCESMRQTLALRAAGLESGEVPQDLAGHLEHCVACQAYAESLARRIAVLHAGREALASEVAGAARHARWMTAVRRSHAPWWQKWLGSPRPVPEPSFSLGYLLRPSRAMLGFMMAVAVCVVSLRLTEPDVALEARSGARGELHEVLVWLRSPVRLDMWLGEPLTPTPPKPPRIGQSAVPRRDDELDLLV